VLPGCYRRGCNLARTEDPVGWTDLPSPADGGETFMKIERNSHMVSSEGKSEYYIVCVYRGQTGPGGSKLVGSVADRDGTRRAFRDFKEMVQVLAEAMRGHGRRGDSEG
jgi:hypothetical protein